MWIFILSLILTQLSLASQNPSETLYQALSVTEELTGATGSKSVGGLVCIKIQNASGTIYNCSQTQEYDAEAIYNALNTDESESSKQDGAGSTVRIYKKTAGPISCTKKTEAQRTTFSCSPLA